METKTKLAKKIIRKINKLKGQDMKQKIYATYNKLTCELHNQTFMAPNDDVAKNILVNGMYNDKGELDKNAIRNSKNYRLCHLGEYDTECGVTDLGGDYRIVAEGEDLVPKDENSPKAE